MQVYSWHLFPWPDIEDADDAEWPFARVPYDPERAKELYENYLEQIEFTDEAGWDGVILNEHHFSAYAMDPSPPVLASHIAARTEHLDLSFLGNVVPIRGNPIRLAEELAVIDTISGGRVIGGFARGIGIEYLAYNEHRGPIGPGEDVSRDMFEEAIALIHKAWTAEEPFDWDGEFWEYENVYIWPKPYQQPRPRTWMPATSEPSIRIAAKHGLSLAQRGELEVAKQGYETYSRIAEEEFGWTPDEENYIWLNGIFVGEDGEAARESIKQHINYHWEYLFGGVHRGAAARNAGAERYDPEAHRELIDEHAHQFLDYDADEAVEGMLVGEPETIVAEIERLYEDSCGFGHLAGTFQHGDAPQEKTMRSLELFADEVLPEIKKLG